MYSKTIAVLLLFSTLIECKQDTTHTGDFGIYLLRDDTLTTLQAKQIPLNALTLDNQPLISINEIVSYYWSDHSIKLTTEGIDKFKSIVGRRKSNFGIPFIVVVGNEKVYIGNVYLIPSSYMPGDIPYIANELSVKSLRIRRVPLKNIEDARNDERVYKALLKRKKLK